MAVPCHQTQTKRKMSPLDRLLFILIVCVSKRILVSAYDIKQLNVPLELDDLLDFNLMTIFVVTFLPRVSEPILSMLTEIYLFIFEWSLLTQIS